MQIARILGNELTEMSNTIDAQGLLIEEYRMKAAEWKAYFFHKNELAEKLEKQLVENTDSLAGEFDGFCYSSKRARAVFRSLEDMVREGIISNSEYGFCKTA